MVKKGVICLHIALIMALSWSCLMRQKQAENNLAKSFFEATNSPFSSVEEEVLADTLFHYSIPQLSVNRQYVYLLNASCSFCIAKAMECYAAYLKTDPETPFVFLSKTDDPFVFQYYFEERFNIAPACFNASDPINTIVR